MLIQHNNKFAELAKMAENVSSRNCACIVNCLKKGDIQLLHSLVEGIPDHCIEVLHPTYFVLALIDYSL